MKNSKRLLGLVMAATMVAGGLAGCSGGGNDTADSTAGNAAENDSANTGAEASSQEPYEAVMVYFAANDAMDADSVEAELNKLTQAELNITVDLIPMTLGTYGTQMQLMLSGGEKVDIFPAFQSNVASYMDADFLVDLAPYLDNCSNILEYVGKEDVLCASVGDFIWGIPTMKERANPYGFVCRTDILEDCGIDVSNVKTYEDMTGVFKTVQEKYPEMTVFGGSGNMIFGNFSGDVDSLGDRLGVLEDYGQTTTVTNYYESDLYKKLVNIAREWWVAGYTSKDLPTSSDSGETLMKAGNLFCFCTTMKPNTKAEKDLQTGYDTTVIQIESVVRSSNMTASTGYCVSTNSDDPDRAVQLLDWIYGSEAANDLLNWGVEGKDWVFKDDGTMTYPEGVTSENCGYHQNFGWALPNQFNSHVWEGTDPDVWSQYAEFNNSGYVSMAYGFNPDLSGCANEVAACTDVVNQYSTQLSTGSVDPEAGLEEFNAALYEAGLQTIIDTKQQQLNDWFAANGNSSTADPAGSEGE